MLDWFQEGLGWVGMIVPAVGAIPDLLNAGIHTLRGNYTDAAMSVFFAIPIVGDAAAAGNKLKKGADKVGDVLHSVDNAVDSAKAAENAASAGKNAAKNHAAQEAFEKGDIHGAKIQRPQVCAIDATGKVHGDLPSSVPKSWTREQLLEAEEALEHSIKTRKAEQIRLGEDGPHRARIGAEDNLLRQIRKRLSGT